MPRMDTFGDRKGKGKRKMREEEMSVSGAPVPAVPIY